jgi:beta-glucosidase
VDVTNTGSVAGKEVVQVYVHDRRSSLVRPFKELKGFAKVALDPGETRTISIPLDFRSFAYYHPAHEQWITEDGDFDILIGASSADIRQRIVVHLRSSLKLAHRLDSNSTIREWLEDSRGRAILEPVIRKLVEQMSIAMANGEYTDETIAATMNNFMDMPLYVVFNYLERLLPMLPEKMIDYLITKIKE